MRIQPTGGDVEGLERELGALGTVHAPRRLLPGVLSRVGLADSAFSLETPVGPVFVAYNHRGISAVMPAREPGDFEQVFHKRFGRRVFPAAEAPASLVRMVSGQLQGSRHEMRFDLRGLSEFERAVLHKALEIPRGEVRSYAWVAREIGRPRAARAVGTALAHNPVPLLIPCHRVIRAGGEIGQYVFGSEAKRAVLEAEGVSAVELEDLAQQGVRYIGSGTTGIYCLPTCRHARRITSRHQHRFHSAQEAVASGFRPCQVCRPAEEGA